MEDEHKKMMTATGPIGAKGPGELVTELPTIVPQSQRSAEATDRVCLRNSRGEIIIKSNESSGFMDDSHSKWMEGNNIHPV